MGQGAGLAPYRQDVGDLLAGMLNRLDHRRGHDPVAFGDHEERRLARCQPALDVLQGAVRVMSHGPPDKRGSKGPDLRAQVARHPVGHRRAHVLPSPRQRAEMGSHQRCAAAPADSCQVAARAKRADALEAAFCGASTTTPVPTLTR